MIVRCRGMLRAQHAPLHSQGLGEQWLGLRILALVPVEPLPRLFMLRSVKGCCRAQHPPPHLQDLGLEWLGLRIFALVQIQVRQVAHAGLACRDALRLARAVAPPGPW